MAENNDEAKLVFRTNGTLASCRPYMDLFLDSFRKLGNVYYACREAGVNRSTVYRWRERWSTFADEWEEAKEEAVDLLDYEARRRAVKEGSDRLLIFLLKAHRPDIYNPPRRIANAEGETFTVEFDLDAWQDKRASRLARYEEKASKVRDANEAARSRLDEE